MSQITTTRSGNLIIPYASSTRRTKQVDNTVLALSSSTGSGFAVTYANAIAYADSTGKWRLNFNAHVTWTGGATQHALAITGVTFAGYVGVTASPIDAATTTTYMSRVNSGTNTFQFNFSASTTALVVSGDVALSSEPNWVAMGTTASAVMEGIVAADVYVPFGQTGMPGEVKRTTAISGTTVGATDTDITGASLTLTAGTWQVFYNIEVDIVTGAAAGNRTLAFCGIYNSSNAIIADTMSRTGINTVANVSCNGNFMHCGSTVIMTSGATYKLRGSRLDIAGTGAVNFTGTVGNAFYAVRLAP